MYPSNLSDKEWELICHHFEPKDRRGSSHKSPKKLIVDAINPAIKYRTHHAA
jgi:putative transposase